MKKLFLAIFLLMAVPAFAQAPQPQWVRDFFSGEVTPTDDIAGVAFLDIKKREPTQREIFRAQDEAKYALARQLDTAIESENLSIMSEENGIVFDYAESKSRSLSRMKIRTNPPQQWLDARGKRLWVRVGIPKDKVEEWLVEIPELPMPVAITSEHGLIYDMRRDKARIRLEDGRKLIFKTNAFIDTGDRVIVRFHGIDPKEVYCKNQKLSGTISRSGRR